MFKGKENELRPQHLWLPDEEQLKVPMRWSRLLGRVALLLWLISLALPGLVYHNDKLFGWEILFMGWLGPLQLIFGWYANPFFLFAVNALIREGRAPIFSSGIATTMALTIFPYALFSRGHSGYYTDLYGFGFGALVWLIAILLLMIAAGLRRIEMQREPLELDYLMREPLFRWGLLLLFLATGALAYLGISDRLQAGESERRFLKEVIYKVGPVCDVPDIKPLGKIALEGPLEIVSEDGYSTPFARPKDLLAWGVPRVRRNGYDYYLREPDNRNSMVAVPGEGPAGARLEMSHGKKKGFRTIRARLVSVDEQTVGFEGEWTAPGSKERFHCPGYFTWPKENEPPRSLLLATLAHADGSPLVGRAAMKSRKNDWLKEVEVVSERPTQRAQITNNPGCPQGVGLHRRAREEEENTLPKTVWKQLTGSPVEMFQIGEQLHYGSHGEVRRALCAQDAAYIYSGERWDDKVKLSLEKRYLPDFKLDWRKGMSTKVSKLASLPRGARPDIYLTSVQETENWLYLKIAVFEQGSDEGVEVKIEAALENL